MKHLTVETILSVCRGRWTGGTLPLGEISAVTTDSRTVTPGCLFAAIAGERTDGHNYIGGALASGALCVLAERLPEGVCGNVILVDDTLTALQALAAFYRAQFSIPVLGVTGSVGKTTAKEMVASVLSQRFCVHKTAGNFNNDLGVPLTLFGLRPEHQAAVIEMGVSHPGDMDRLAEIVRPTMSLFTVIGDAHLEYLKSREGILAEKSKVNSVLPPEGTVFCNGDDPLLRDMACAQKKLSFGLNADCTVRAEALRTLPDGTTACTIRCGDRKLEAVSPAYGAHMVYAMLEGAAVGFALGLTDEEITRGIAAYAPVGSRARRIGTGFCTVIDDCYNANPTSMASAIRSLAADPGRKVCILGDMLELGEQSAALHFETGALARDCGAALVLAVGTEAAEIARGAGEIGRHFPTKEALLEALPELLQPGDTVLVKASHSMQFDKIVAWLKEQ